MNTPIDELTLALTARQTPSRILYAVGRHVGSTVFAQHALCCVRERRHESRAVGRYDYYLVHPNYSNGSTYTANTFKCVLCQNALSEAPYE